MMDMLSSWAVVVLLAVLVVGTVGVLVGVRLVASRVEHHDPDATHAWETGAEEAGRLELPVTRSDEPGPPEPP